MTTVTTYHPSTLILELHIILSVVLNNLKCVMSYLSTSLNFSLPISTFPKSYYSQLLKPPYRCILAPPLHMHELSQHCFPRLACHECHSHLILYNLVHNLYLP